MVTLTGRRVLIVEDDYLLASDLAQSLQKMGAIILGPSPTLSLAEPYCGMAEAAVLDINLRGDTV